MVFFKHKHTINSVLEKYKTYKIG